MPWFLEDMQLHLANFHQWFAEKEVIPWGNVVAVLSNEMNLSDEIVQKLYEYMKPTALLKPTTYQTQSKSMAFYCKEYNGIHSFMRGCVVCVINAVVCVCVCVFNFAFVCICAHALVLLHFG